MLSYCEKTPYLDGTFFKVVDCTNLNGNVKAACQVCPADAREYSGSARVSTNWLRYLKRKHEGKLDEYETYKKQKKIHVDPTPAIFRRVTCNFSQQQFDEDVINYISENLLPLSTVEDKAFRKIFDDFNIKHGNLPLQHMSRHKAKKVINSPYIKEIEDISNKLKNATYVCTTADIWSGSNRRFLGVTAHYLEEKTLERHSAALACRVFPGTHSYDRIAEQLDDIHLSFGLDIEKVVATITDNGSNFVKAFKEFGMDNPAAFLTEDTENIQNLEESNNDENDCEMEQDGNFSNYINLPNHFRCASHTLNLIATTDTMKAISTDKKIEKKYKAAIKKCEAIWKIHRSPKKYEDLRKHIECSLKRPVITRWNSLYDALKQIEDLKDKLMDPAMKNIVTDSKGLSNNDFALISDYLIWVEPLSKSIDKLQAEQSCHYGILLPILLILRKKWIKMLDTLQIFGPVLRLVINNLESRFRHIMNIEGPGEFAAIATLMHPKFKISFITALDEESQKRLYSLIEKIKTNFNIVQETSGTNCNDDEFFDFDNPEGPLGLLNVEENEFIQFLNQKPIDLAILDNFPRVKSFFLKYNTPLPSSAPVERLFSYATLLNLPKFNRLDDTEFEKRIFLKANSKK